MKKTNVTGLTADELNRRMVELEQDYHTALEAVQAGQEKNSNRPGQIRRDLARVKTACSRRIWQIEQSQPKPAQPKQAA